MREGKEYYVKGHLMAFACVVFWGTAYIASKKLLGAGFAPPYIILCRQGLAYVLLCLITHRFVPIGGIAGLKRDRFLFLAGCMGVAMYYLLESTAMLFTYATNVSLMVAISPLFATLFNQFLPAEDRMKLGRTFFPGLALCLAGVCLVILNGTKLHLNPLGDFIGLLASASWAGYSFFLSKARRVNEAQEQPLDDLLLTRRSMFYGVIVVFAVFLVTGGKFEGAMFNLRNFPLLLYLAALPSACSFLLWGKAINRIGMLNTSLYVNLSPLITVISAAIFLKEQLTLISGIGMAAIVLGLAITQNVFGRLFRSSSVRIN